MAALVLQRVHTMGLGLAVGLTLDDGALAATTLHAHAVDNVALLGLVAETTSLISTSGTRSAVNGRQLAELPAANAQKEAQDIALLLLVQLFKILVGTHFCLEPEPERSK